MIKNNKVQMPAWTNNFPEDDIVKIWELKESFMLDEISYKEFEGKMQKLGYKVKVDVEIPNTRKLTIDMYKELKERLRNGNYLSEDINHYIFIDKDGKEYKGDLNYKSIEIAAKKGSKRAQETMYSIRKQQYNIMQGFLPFDDIIYTADFQKFLENPNEYVENWERIHKPAKRNLLSRIKTLFN